MVQYRITESDKNALVAMASKVARLPPSPLSADPQLFEGQSSDILFAVAPLEGIAGRIFGSPNIHYESCKAYRPVKSDGVITLQAAPDNYVIDVCNPSCDDIPPNAIILAVKERWGEWVATQVWPECTPPVITGTGTGTSIVCVPCDPCNGCASACYVVDIAFSRGTSVGKSCSDHWDGPYILEWGGSSLDCGYTGFRRSGSGAVGATLQYSLGKWYVSFLSSTLVASFECDEADFECLGESEFTNRNWPPPTSGGNPCTGYFPATLTVRAVSCDTEFWWCVTGEPFYGTKQEAADLYGDGIDKTLEGPYYSLEELQHRSLFCHVATTGTGTGTGTGTLGTHHHYWCVDVPGLGRTCVYGTRGQADAAGGVISGPHETADGCAALCLPTGTGTGTGTLGVHHHWWCVDVPGVGKTCIFGTRGQADAAGFVVDGPFETSGECHSSCLPTGTGTGTDPDGSHHYYWCVLNGSTYSCFYGTLGQAEAHGTILAGGFSSSAECSETCVACFGCLPIPASVTLHLGTPGVSVGCDVSPLDDTPISLPRHEAFGVACDYRSATATCGGHTYYWKAARSSTIGVPGSYDWVVEFFQDISVIATGQVTSVDCTGYVTVPLTWDEGFTGPDTVCINEACASASGTGTGGTGTGDDTEGWWCIEDGTGATGTGTGTGTSGEGGGGGSCQATASESSMVPGNLIEGDDCGPFTTNNSHYWEVNAAVMGQSCLTIEHTGDTAPVVYFYSDSGFGMLFDSYSLSTSEVYQRTFNDQGDVWVQVTYPPHASATTYKIKLETGAC